MATGNVRIRLNEIRWSVPDLDAPEMKDDSYYYSPEFHISGKSWYLGLQLDDEVSVSLVRIWGESSSLPVKFSVSLKAANGQKEYKRWRMGLFEVFGSYSIDRLLSRKEYRRRKSELCSSGSVMIICQINILTADDLCNVIKEYDDSQLKLEEENFDIKKELDACKADKESLLNELKSTRENFGASNASASFDVHQHDKILQDLKQALQKQENCDVVLRVKGQEFPAHKVILAARSPIFACTFRNDMKEKETGVLDIQDCDPSVFAHFLCFLYCDDVDSLSKENVFSLFTAADKYDVKDFRKMCLEFMKENLSVETFCETLTLALQHSESDLIRLVTDFFIRNADKIVVTVKWQSFAADNPTQSNELIIKLVESDWYLKS